VRKIVLDCGDQLTDAFEGATTNPLLADLAEPPLHHVQPAAGGRREMKVKALVPRQPALHRGALVGAGVMHNEVQRQIGGRFALDSTQESDEIF